MITGGCLCGAVRYEIDADQLADDASYCHCSMCRRWSGSAFKRKVIYGSDGSWLMKFQTQRCTVCCAVNGRNVSDF